MHALNIISIIKVIYITTQTKFPIHVIGFVSHIEPSSDTISYKEYKRKYYTIQLVSGDEISTLTSEV